MTPKDFTWWCHGWDEINGGGCPTSGQWKVIVDHLCLTLGIELKNDGFILNGVGGYRKEDADKKIEKSKTPIDVRLISSFEFPHIIGKAWTGKLYDAPIYNQFTLTGC